MPQSGPRISRLGTQIRDPVFKCPNLDRGSRDLGRKFRNLNLESGNPSVEREHPKLKRGNLE